MYFLFTNSNFCYFLDCQRQFCDPHATHHQEYDKSCQGTLLRLDFSRHKYAPNVITIISMLLMLSKYLILATYKVAHIFLTRPIQGSYMYIDEVMIFCGFDLGQRQSTTLRFLNCRRLSFASLPNG